MDGVAGQKSVGSGTGHRLDPWSIRGLVPLLEGADRAWLDQVQPVTDEGIDHRMLAIGADDQLAGARGTGLNFVSSPSATIGDNVVSASFYDGIQLNDSVDALNDSVFRILLTHMMGDPRTIGQGL